MYNIYDNPQFDALAFMANICQLASFGMNVTQVSNDKIIKRLEKQDIVLDEQTNNYLKKITEQNEEILKLLKSLQK